MDIHLSLHLKSSLSLTPSLRQSIHFLYLSFDDLVKEISQLAERNPFIDFQSKELESLENIESQPLSLSERLLDQISFIADDDKERSLLSIFAYSLDDEGYLDLSHDDLHSLQEETGYTHEEFEAVLKKFRLLDPVGIGSRTLEEKILTQLSIFCLDDVLRELCALLIKNHLKDITSFKYDVIRKKCGLSEKKFLDVMTCIRSLPIRILDNLNTDKAIVQTTDLMVMKENGSWVCRICEEHNVRIRINEHSCHVDSEISAYLENAHATLRSLEQRYKTLLRVGQAIVDCQLDFFELGISSLKPLSMKKIAERLAISESTISRVVNQKFLSTPYGILELKYFFSQAVDRHSGPCSATFVKSLIKRYILQENKQVPLSDSDIVTLLEKQGISLARRTVSKYRNYMRIPSSDTRRNVNKQTEFWLRKEENEYSD